MRTRLSAVTVLAIGTYRLTQLPGAVKWVVIVAYSVASKARLRTLKTQGKLTATDEEGAFVAGILRV